MQQTYKLVRAEDNIVWVSIQPLASDIKDVITLMADIDMKKLSDTEKREFDLKLIGLKAIYTFLDVLMQQQVHDENANRSPVNK